MKPVKIGFSLKVRIAISIIFGSLLLFAAVVSFFDIRAMLLVGVSAALWWRILSLKVTFFPTEMIITGFFSQKRVNYRNAVGIEDGAKLIYLQAGRRKKAIIALALGYSTPDDRTPDGRMKREIISTFDDWKRGASSRPA
ncbi:hypothetical protein [Curtobacterium sp. SORGH_AS_0776]|uniref:hypothetical protein n=1 Tax=Curtobacterium sp. SORGH_AS_0776 TaxID=3041798 RepID=UPI0028651EAA|nr:hypothetical protein [Curtobacterium sp. SORGH_AS_0776]MDR6169784.1 hypothetical protein [Curtobacterium sp. SORGH_AS_0776]